MQFVTYENLFSFSLVIISMIGLLFHGPEHKKEVAVPTPQKWTATSLTDKLQGANRLCGNASVYF